MSTLIISSKRSTLVEEIGIVVSASVFIALFAKVHIPLPFTPIPIVLQDTMVIFFGVVMGARRGAAVAFSFLAQGAMGLPVLAGGAGGLAKFVGPTGGYLIGYLLAAFAAGWIVERLGQRTLGTACIGFLTGSLVLFTCGVAYLSTFIGFSSALLLGVIPFIPGNLIKTLCSLQLLKIYRNLYRS